MTGAPLTPDFATHRAGDTPDFDTDGEFLTAKWPDGLTGRWYGLFLRENEVRPRIVSAETREREIAVDLLPETCRPVSATLDDGAAVIRWDNGDESRLDPAWLRSLAEGRWRPDHGIPEQLPWERAEMPEPLSFDGRTVMKSDASLADWLGAAWKHGFARLRGLPTVPGTVRDVAERIGTVRNSNFGFVFTVETKPDPDSNAYRAVALDGHTDLATRETQPGLQILHCLENTATGGASTMADGFAVAKAIRAENPDAFDALTTLKWVFTNRHRQTDYRYSGPLIETDAAGRIAEIRNTGFLRFYPDMEEAQVPRAYRALRLFATHARSDRFVCRTVFAAGDLVLFDNRRMLHGRDGFDQQSGVRRLEGCYLDRDEILSRLRILARQPERS